MFFTLLANNAGPYTGPTGNNTYLFPGAEPALIDAGIGSPAHLAAIEERLAGVPLARVIVTHAHSDHAGGVEAIARRWPNVEFLKMPWPDRDARYPVRWRPVSDGDLLHVGDRTLEAIHTPGHAPDHICLWHRESRSMFCGDLATQGTTVVIPGGKGGSIVEYVRSLERVLAIGPDVLLPSHGPAIYRVERTLRRYIEHRREREEQIVHALEEQPRTVDQLLDMIYPAIHPKLQPAAHDSIVAHLQKLQDERRAEETGGVWALSSPGSSC